MNATDFEYDGRYARDFGLVICSMGSNDDVISLGSELNFNSVPIGHGAIHHSTAVTYDSVLETTFQVFKFDCKQGMIPLNIDEHREISRWLNRKEPHILRLIGEDEAYDYVHFEGSFLSISKIELGGLIYGYELKFVTNRPFALGDTIRYQIDSPAGGCVYRIEDLSDEVGHIYPKMSIYCPTALDRLIIKNSAEGRVTELYNILAEETIMFDESLYFHSDNGHDIQNDFNYEFFRIANTYDNRINDIEVSDECIIQIEYTPIIKGVGF